MFMMTMRKRDLNLQFHSKCFNRILPQFSRTWEDFCRDLEQAVNESNGRQNPQ